MPEIYNSELLDQLRALQGQVNSAINALSGYTGYRLDMTSAAKTSRINDIKTRCSGIGVTATDWLGNDAP